MFWVPDPSLIYYSPFKKHYQYFFFFYVTDLDTNENDNNQQNVMGSAKWWDSLSTMTEAKIALQYLFEKAAENMATLSNSKTQNKVGRRVFFTKFS